MKLLTKEISDKLIANGIKQEAYKNEHMGAVIDFKPVLKLFNPCGAATWLISEIFPDNHDIAFGLCDLGFNCPELGDVSLSELAETKLMFGLGIERDMYFKADKTISQYADEARELGRIAA